MKLKFYALTLLALLLTVMILSFPEDCLQLAQNGLQLWYDKMIPALFPFMVLSGIIIRMNLTSCFVRILDPLLGRLFQVSKACVYGILMGFLCGFPMGAHTAAQLYEQKQITRKEASFLLAFCNNIGPVYFLGFVLPLLNIKEPALYLFGMYGLPFLYGLFLRYSVYSDLSCQQVSDSTPKKAPSLLSALDSSIASGLLGIGRLGGYMIFFNLLFIFPDLLSGLLPGLYPGQSPLFADNCKFISAIAACLLEITGGIRRLCAYSPRGVLLLLPFGGLSCIAQTYAMIRETDLSLAEYVMHKAILTAITVFFYLFAAGICS